MCQTAFERIPQPVSCLQFCLFFAFSIALVFSQQTKEVASNTPQRRKLVGRLTTCEEFLRYPIFILSNANEQASGPRGCVRRQRRFLYLRVDERFKQTSNLEDANARSKQAEDDSEYSINVSLATAFSYL